MLHNRILFGMIPFIVLLMVIGGYAIWLFVRLGGVANTTLRENHTSIVAMPDLKEVTHKIDQVLFADHAGGMILPQIRSTPADQAICVRVDEREKFLLPQFLFGLPANAPVMSANPSRR